MFNFIKLTHRYRYNFLPQIQSCLFIKGVLERLRQLLWCVRKTLNPTVDIQITGLDIVTPVLPIVYALRIIGGRRMFFGDDADHRPKDTD